MRTCECPFKLCNWKPHVSVFPCCAAATSCTLFAILFIEFQNLLPNSMICMHIYWSFFSNKIDPIFNKVDSALKNCCLAFENRGNQRRTTTRPVRGEHQVKLYTQDSQASKAWGQTVHTWQPIIINMRSNCSVHTGQPGVISMRSNCTHRTARHHKHQVKLYTQDSQES